MYQLPPLTAEQILVYLRKSRSDDPALTVEDVLEKHETLLNEWVDNRIGSEAVPEKNRYREVVSGETVDARPEMQRLLRAVENPGIKAVLVVEPQRLSRGDLEDAGRIIRILRYTHTLVLTTSYCYDLSDERDRDDFARELKRGNEFLEYTKKILNRGRLEAVKRGCFIGQTAPYGYQKATVKEGKRVLHTLTPNPEEAAVVRRIFELYTQGHGHMSIANHLNQAGIRTRTGKTWNHLTLRDMLRNDHYIGKVVWYRKKEQRVVKDGELTVTRPLNPDYLVFDGLHPAIVEETVFREAQTRMALNPPNPASKNFVNPLAGLFYCGYCGKAISRRRYMNRGVEYAQPRYLCTNSSMCGAGSAFVDDVLDEVKVLLAQNIADFEVLLKQKPDNESTRHQADIRRLEKRLLEYDTRELSMWQDKYEGKIPDSVFDRLNAKLQEERETDRVSLERLRKLTHDTVKIENQIATFKQALTCLQDTEAPAKEQNYLLKQCIKRIEFKRPRNQHPSNSNPADSPSIAVTLNI